MPFQRKDLQDLELMRGGNDMGTRLCQPQNSFWQQRSKQQHPVNISQICTDKKVQKYMGNCELEALLYYSFDTTGIAY